MDKTHNKQENGQFVKFTDTESTFNNQVQEIMSSNFSTSLAFVERLHKTHMEETIYTIDLNKCRQNISLNHKYDHCVMLWMISKNLILIAKLLNVYIILRLIIIFH